MGKGKITQYLNNCVKYIDNFLNNVIEKRDIRIKNPSSSNLKSRIISSVILIPLAIYAFYFSRGLFLFLAISATIIMVFEWIDLTKSAKNRQKWNLIGFIYILIPVWAVLQLRDIDSNIILWMFFVIWATDIFAYFAGKTLGGPKLAPNVSPNKTWSGLIGGVLASMIIGFISSFIFVSGNIVFFVVISGLLAIAEQLSDLIESKFKRIFGVKDTGNLIPGHGGILDRLDGLMLVAPIVLFLVCIYSDKFIV